MPGILNGQLRLKGGKRRGEEKNFADGGKFKASRMLKENLKDGGRGPNAEDTRRFVAAVIEIIQ